MTIRLACASTFTVLGLTCSSMTSAREVAYMAAPAIHAAPARSLPLPTPLPMQTTVVVAAPTNHRVALALESFTKCKAAAPLSDASITTAAVDSA